MDAPRKSIADATFNVYGVEIRCHVLEDGTRIVEEQSVIEFLEAMVDGPPVMDHSSMEDFAAWIRGGPTRR